MAYQAIGIGSSANDGTGDDLRTAGDKVNDNFVEIYTLLGTGTALSSGISATASVVTLTAPLIATSLNPASANGAALGSASAEWSDLYLADGGVIYLGADQDVRIIHDADDGLLLKTSATSDDNPFTLILQTGETDLDANDIIGSLSFQAPDELSEGDSRLVSASVDAVAEGTFSATNNATKLSFKLGVSETATEKMSLSSAGLLTIADDLVIGDGKTIGSTSDPDAMTISASGVVTFSQSPNFGLDLTIEDDLFLDSDAAVVHFGEDGDVTLTHVADTGLLLNTTMVIQFRDAAINIGSPADGDLDINADDEIELNSTLIDINGNVEISGTAAITGIATFTDDIIIGDGKTIGSASDVDAITIASNGQVTLTQTLIGTALDISGNIDIDGTANLDVVDIDGAVDMASTLNVAGNVGIGATSSPTPLFINKAVADHTSTAITIQNSQAGGYGGQIIFKSAQTNGNILTAATIGTDGAAAWNSTGNTSSNLKFSTMGGGTLAEKMRILSDGGLCINRTNQANSERLAITGNSSSQCMSLTSPITGGYDMINLINGNGQVGRIGTDGSASQFVTSSDYRLKENVSYSFDATSRLKQLKPARFNFIADADNTLVDGFIAHEVSSIVPEAISGTKDAMTAEVLYVDGDEIPDGKEVGDVKTASQIDPQGIDQSKLVPLLVKTLQEALTEIDTLKTKVQALEDA